MAFKNIITTNIIFTVIMTISNQNVFANESVEMSAKINVEEISEKSSFLRGANDNDAKTSFSEERETLSVPPGQCADLPMDWESGNFSRWHDSGDERFTCEWYGSSDSNYYCSMYGDRFPNHGKTANVACCACGGGLDNRAPPVNQNPPLFEEFLEFRSKNNGRCLGVNYNNDGIAVIWPCTSGWYQLWTFDERRKWLRNKKDNSLCLTRNIATSIYQVTVQNCDALRDTQKWEILDSNNGVLLKSFDQDKCLAVQNDRTNLKIMDCNEQNPKQKFLQYVS